jgi:hypothetical protein
MILAHITASYRFEIAFDLIPLALLLDDLFEVRSANECPAWVAGPEELLTEKGKAWLKA